MQSIYDSNIDLFYPACIDSSYVCLNNLFKEM